MGGRARPWMQTGDQGLLGQACASMEPMVPEGCRVARMQGCQEKQVCGRKGEGGL